MKRNPTEIRLSINHGAAAMEYYLNNHMLREQVQVAEVVWEPKEQQFRIVLNEKEGK